MGRTLAPRSYPGLASLLIGAAFLYRLPVLRTGFTVDDYAQLGMMRGFYAVPRQALQLFTFSAGGLAENVQLRAAGFFPWWSEVALRISLFRPLSSALMWLDLRLFGDDAFLYHLHSAGWWLCMMALLAAVLRRALPAWPALLALALCCVQGAHGMFLGWIANRNAVVASTFSLLGLWILLRASESGAKRARGFALFAYALALCAGEYAVGFLAYAVCYEWQTAQSSRQRVERLVLWCGLLALYLLVRASLGFGTHGSGMYIDPLSESGAFLQAALVRLPVSVGDLVLGIQANWWSAGFPYAEAWARLGLLPLLWARDMEPLQGVQVACGVLALLIGGGMCLALFRRRASPICRQNRWVALATPLALLPSLSSVSESRLLLPPLLGWSIVMATWVYACAIRLPTAPGYALRRVGRVGLLALVMCQLLGPPYYVWPTVHGLPQLAQAVRSAILAPQLDDMMRSSRRVLLLAAADPTSTIYLPLVRQAHGRPAPRGCQLLTTAYANQRLDRLDARTFAIERVQTTLTPLDIYATAFRRAPLRAGETFRADGMQVTVERAFEGRPTRTRYTLDLPLDDPGVVLLQQTINGMRRIWFPPVGYSLVLGPPVAPFALVANP